MTTAAFPRRLSPTSIDRWRTCPRRFLYQDVERRDFDDVKTFEQLLGEVVHKVLESLFRRQPDDRDAAGIKRLLDGAISRFAFAPALKDGNDARLREQASEQLLRFVSTRDISTRPLKLEQPFQLRLKNGTTIQTRIHRLDRGQSGTLEIVDYKTGRYQVDERDLGNETAPIVQLLAVSEASDIPVGKVTWLYLRSNEAAVWWPEAEDVEAATDRLIRLLREMHLDTKFEPNPGGHCAICPFGSVCPAAATTVAKPAIEKAA